MSSTRKPPPIYETSSSSSLRRVASAGAGFTAASAGSRGPPGIKRQSSKSGAGLGTRREKDMEALQSLWRKRTGSTTLVVDDDGGQEEVARRAVGEISNLAVGHESCVGGIPGEVRCLCLVGETVWSGERDGTISIRSAKNGVVMKTMDPRETRDNTKDEFVWCLVLVENHVWSGSSKGTIRVWDASTGEFVAAIHQHVGGIYCLLHHAGRVYSASNDFTIGEFDAEGMTFVKQYTGHSNQVRSLCAVGPLLFSGSDDYSIRVWDIETGECVRELTRHKGGVITLIRVRSTIWSGSDDKTICVWNAMTGDLVTQLEGHKSRISSLVKIGDKVWSGSADKNICVWDTRTYQCLSILQEHSGYISDMIAVARTEKYLLWSGSSDRTIRVWTGESFFHYIDYAEARGSEEVDIYKQRMRQLEKRCEEEQAQRQETVRVNESLRQECEERLASEKRSIEETYRVMAEDLEERNQKDINALRKQLAGAEEKIKENAAENKRLEQARTDLLEQTSAYEKTIATMKEETELLSHQLKNMRSTLLERDATIDKLTRRAKDQEAQLEHKDTEIRSRDRRILELENEFTTRVASLRGEIGERDATIMTLEANAASLGRRLESVASDLAVREQRIDSLKGDVSALEQTRSDLQTQLDNRDRDVTSLHEQLQQLRDQLREKDNTIAHKESDISEVRKECDALLRQRTELEIDVRDRDEKIRKAMEETTVHTRKIQELQRQLSNTEGKNETLQKEVSEYTVRLREMDTSNTEKEEALNRKESEKETALQRIGELQHHIENNEETISRLEKATLEEKRKQAESQSMIEERDEALQRLRQHVEEKEREVQQLRSQMDLHTMDLARIEKEKGDVSQQTTMLESALHEKEKEISKLRGEHRASEEHVHSLRAELSRKEAANAALGGEMEILTRRMEELKTHHLGELEERDRVVAGMKGEVQSHTQALVDLRAKMKACEEEYRASFQDKDGWDVKLEEMRRQLVEVEAERDDLQRKFEEFDFILRSRGEFVRECWALYNEIVASKAKAHERVISPLVKSVTVKDTRETLVKEAEEVRDTVDDLRTHAKTIISDFLTEYEKLHLGISVYYFVPSRKPEFLRAGTGLERTLDKMERAGAGAPVPAPRPSSASARGGRVPTALTRERSFGKERAAEEAKTGEARLDDMEDGRKVLRVNLPTGHQPDMKLQMMESNMTLTFEVMQEGKKERVQRKWMLPFAVREGETSAQYVAKEGVLDVIFGRQADTSNEEAPDPSEPVEVAEITLGQCSTDPCLKTCSQERMALEVEETEETFIISGHPSCHKEVVKVTLSGSILAFDCRHTFERRDGAQVKRISERNQRSFKLPNRPPPGSVTATRVATGLEVSVRKGEAPLLPKGVLVDIAIART